MNFLMQTESSIQLLIGKRVNRTDEEDYAHEHFQNLLAHGFAIHSLIFKVEVFGDSDKGVIVILAHCYSVMRLKIISVTKYK